jgi:EAL domain-containing protein (putative c-di-GMP-specific phosphodiesterase class I)
MSTARMNTTTHRSHAANAAPGSGHALRRRVLAGIAAGEFCVAYQGIYRVDNGELAQMEALIRWRHPDYGVLLPGAFCETFKDSEVILAITWLVMETVARDIVEWQSNGGARYSVAVNVPPSVAMMPGFAEHMEAICAAHGVAPDCIELELSESEDLARFPGIGKLVQRLRNKGINIAMDDFGTGYACLAALGPVGFGTVKIAKELLADAAGNETTSTVFSSILDLLTRLKVGIVVEGVETPAQAQWLAQWPHVMAQGFFLARPIFGMEHVPGARRSRIQARTHERHAHRIRLADAA